MAKLNPEIRRVVEVVGSRTNLYLSEEADIETIETTYRFHNLNHLKLNYLTSIMAIEGHLKVLFAFSFEWDLAKKIMKSFTAELNVDESEHEEYTEETIAEMINMILGNALSEFEVQGQAIRLTPPVVISDAKNIYRNCKALFLSANIHTDQGNMQIHCIGPKELFDSELNYIQERS